MKHLLTLVSFGLLATTADATVHTVTCQNGAYHFLPVTINANVGDTIHWTWVSGTHIVGAANQSDIPAGATNWYGLINSTNHTFDYVLAYPGIYHYMCHPANPHGEDGYINVSGTTAAPVAEAAKTTLFYPNPFTDKFTLEATGATGMVMHNLLGEAVGSFAFANGTKLCADTGDLPVGFYFCSIVRDGIARETLRVVKQ